MQLSWQFGMLDLAPCTTLCYVCHNTGRSHLLGVCTRGHKLTHRITDVVVVGVCGIVELRTWPFLTAVEQVRIRLQELGHAALDMQVHSGRPSARRCAHEEQSNASCNAQVNAEPWRALPRSAAARARTDAGNRVASFDNDRWSARSSRIAAVPTAASALAAERGARIVPIKVVLAVLICTCGLRPSAPSTAPSSPSHAISSGRVRQVDGAHYRGLPTCGALPLQLPPRLHS